MEFFVKDFPTGSKSIPVRLYSGMTILDLKREILAAQPDFPIESQRIIILNKLMDDSYQISDSDLLQWQGENSPIWVRKISMSGPSSYPGKLSNDVELMLADLTAIANSLAYMHPKESNDIIEIARRLRMES